MPRRTERPDDYGRGRDSGGTAETHRAKAAARRMHSKADGIRRRELDTALDRLDARGEITDEQRAILRQFTERITECLVGPAAQDLREAAAAGDDETVAAALDLFGADGE